MTFRPPTTGAQVVARARTQIGLKTIYKLGAGGMKPENPRASNTAGGCDCSGFASWAVGRSRMTADPWYRKLNGGWFETTAIFRDCATPFGIFDGVEWLKGQPGMLVVYGDRFDPVTKKKLGEGHVGVVSRVDESGPTHAIHCSKGNWSTVGDAIQETTIDFFKRREARIARCAGIDDEGMAFAILE